MDVTSRITEGGKTGVAAIIISGNEAYGASRLKGVMSTTESNFLSFLKSSDVYDPDRIAADLEAIRRFYLRNGYADFRIVSSSAELDTARNGYVINIVVEEGPRYSVSAVDVESRISDVSSDELRRQVFTRAGQTYNAVDVEKSVDALSARLPSVAMPSRRFVPVASATRRIVPFGSSTRLRKVRAPISSAS